MVLVDAYDTPHCDEAQRTTREIERRMKMLLDPLNPQNVQMLKSGHTHPT
jgi:hypothetical protein